MKTRFSLEHIGAARVAATLVAVALTATSFRLQASESPASVSTNTFGTGKQYQTFIERQALGELSAADLNQVSVLTSQFLTHVDRAGQQLADARTDAARTEIEKAQALLKVVRGLLPTTIVTTTVRNAQGKEVYRDEQRVQDDQIPVYSGAVAMEVVEPVIEAKKDEAALKGIKLADAALVRTAVLVDLNFAERKLKRALELITKPQEASAELALIQSGGVHFYAHKEDSPLVDAQHALRIAERMVREKKYEVAKDNLQAAKLQLEAYRALVETGSGHAVAELEKDIQKLSAEIQAPGAADKIRGMWDKVTGWFTRETGQAHQMSPGSMNPPKPTG